MHYESWVLQTQYMRNHWKYEKKNENLSTVNTRLIMFIAFYLPYKWHEIQIALVYDFFSLHCIYVVSFISVTPIATITLLDDYYYIILCFLCFSLFLSNLIYFILFVLIAFVDSKEFAMDFHFIRLIFINSR